MKSYGFSFFTVVKISTTCMHDYRLCYIFTIVLAILCMTAFLIVHENEREAIDRLERENDNLKSEIQRLEGEIAQKDSLLKTKEIHIILDVNGIHSNWGNKYIINHIHK